MGYFELLPGSWLRNNTHTLWRTTPTIQAKRDHHHFIIRTLILYLAKFWSILVHSVDKTCYNQVTVEWIWLLILNVLSFNFVLRFPAVVLINQMSKLHCYFAWCALLKVATFPFFPISRNDNAFSLSIIVEHNCCSNVVNSKVGKQTKRCEIVFHKYIKTKSGITTFSFNPHLVEEADFSFLCTLIRFELNYIAICLCNKDQMS